MATWQYQFYLVPELKLINLLGYLPTHLDQATFDQVNGLHNEYYVQKLEDAFDELLPRAKSWQPASLQIWGDISSNCIELSFSNSFIEEITVRIDLRQINHDMLDNLLKLAVKLELVVVTPDMKVIRPIKHDILADVSLSDAHKFVQEPEKFIISKRNEKKFAED